MDNGSRALAERLCEQAVGHYRDWDFESVGAAAHMGMDQDDPHGSDAAAILANGAAFLPDAAELDRLRRIEAAARALNSKPEQAVTDAAALAALRAALAREGSAGTQKPDPERPPDLYAAVQVVRAYLGMATPVQIVQEEAERLARLRAAEGSARDGG